LETGHGGKENSKLKTNRRKSGRQDGKIKTC
jgi:hypothetical protein